MVHAHHASPIGRVLSTADRWSRAGLIVARYGLVVILLLIGGLKFTHGEATAIQPLIGHSPLLAWTYRVASVDAVSRAIGSVELFTALLVAMRAFLPLASALGSMLATLTFLTTLSFLLSTPGVWDPFFPALSGTGSFLIKDFVLLGASAFTAGEALRAARDAKASG